MQQLQGCGDMWHQHPRTGCALLSRVCICWIKLLHQTFCPACHDIAIMKPAGTTCSRWKLGAHQARSALRWFCQRHSRLHGYRSSHEWLLRFHRMLHANSHATAAGHAPTGQSFGGKGPPCSRCCWYDQNQHVALCHSLNLTLVRRF